MKNKRTFLFLLLLCLLSYVALLFLYPQIPESIPANWGLDGQIGLYQNKSLLLFFGAIPFLILPIIFAPINVTKSAVPNRKKGYSIFMSIVVIFLILLNWVFILPAMQIPLHPSTFLPVLIGGCFLLLGNYMPTLPPSYLVGIRTPWALKDTTVWQKTQRLGGILFCIFGIALIPIAFFQNLPYVICIFSFILLSVPWLFVYSYLLYKKRKVEEK